MHHRNTFFLLGLLVFPAACNFTNGVVPSSISGEIYNEDLFMRPLHDGKVVATFTFTTILLGAAPRDPNDLELSAHHHSLFPLTLGQILREYSITDLHLTLNSGKWNYDNWGLPDDPNVGTGAELWAWMADGAPSTINERWTGLRNALAGHFCASLGSLDAQRTSSPSTAFPLSFPHSTPHTLRYASLPSEHVCTENLTPFVKLLPCKTRAGLATLLGPQRIFDADWHGLGVHVQSTQRGVELKLGVQAVFDPVRLSGGRRRDWSFRMLFDRIIDESCPVAGSSMVRVKAPDGQLHELSPASGVDDGSVTVYNLTAYVPLDVSMSWPHEHSFQYSLPHSPLTPLSIKRTLYGSSQIHGLLSLALTNNEYDDISVGYFENLPALVTLWAHTLTVEVDGIRRDGLISDISYHPHQPLTNGQKSPSTFQATLTIPARSTLRLSIEVSRAFLKYTEHPPDAMRGWDLPPAVFFPVHLSTSSAHGTRQPIVGISGRMYSPTLLIDLPTPDFSMPYNVIILSCTLITLIFGSIFNLITRRWVIVPLEQ
ncbi:GPI transamidase component PIG-T [Scleroderma yunnanense]